MNAHANWRLSATLVVLIAAGFTWGCAQQVDDIDRTQADKIEKELFMSDAEWYLQQTVVDSGMEGGLTFPALESALKRIRWTVTEDVLYAHSTVELADGLNEGFDEEDARRTGVVAAFPIEGHFDVQRQYSASTGEPSNVIVEDTSDRPWYERDYMRVNWATNMVDGFQMFQGQLGDFSPVAHEMPQDDRQANPNRTRISDEFIDTVTDYYYHPNPAACVNAYGLDTLFSCDGGRLSIRTSMKRVPEVETYEPLNYVDTEELTRDGTPGGEAMLTASIFDRELGGRVEVECNDEVKDWMLNDQGRSYEAQCRPANFEYFDRFGYFRTERVEWDRYVGTSDYQRRYYAQRWNIWQSMFDEDGNRLEKPDRTPKPITFYLNLEYPKFMFDAAQETAEEWNKVFRDTVILSMGLENDAALDEKLYDEYGHTDMFRIVENSCHPGPLVDWYNEHGSAHSEDRDSVDGIFADFIGTPGGDEAMEAALWDLSNEARTNLCANLEYATETRPLAEEQFTWERMGDIRYSFFNWIEEHVPWAGYGPSAADPMTGEIIRANANYAGKHIRTNATYGADLVQYFNGELSEDDIIYGTQIRDDLFNNDRDSERFGLTPEGQRELSMRAGVDPAEASATNFEERPNVGDLDPFVLNFGPDRIRQEADIVAYQTSKNTTMDEQMVELLETPRIKALVMSDMEVQMIVEAMARERHGNEFSDEQLHQAYLDLHTPQILMERNRTRDRLLSERNIMTRTSLDRAVENLVTYEGVVDYFAGKSRDDIIEFFMNRVFIGTQLHEIGHNVGLRHNFSAHADALNYHDEYWEIERAVQEGRLNREDAYSIQGDMVQEIIDDESVDYLSQAEFKLASVMDYSADLTGRMAGMGKYDRAAIKFAYGGMVEQWADDVQLPQNFSSELMLSNYTELPLVMADEFAGDDDAYVKGIDIIQDGREFVTLEEAKERRRAGIESNTERWSTYDFDAENPPVIDRTVDYNFCTDDLQGRVLDCKVWAYGGDQREMVNHSFDSFRALQVFWRYRRHNIDRMYDNVVSFQNRLFNTFEVSQEPFRYFSIYRWFDLGVFTDDLQQAAIDGFNFFNEILATPEPGRYCPFDANNTNIDTHWFYDLENTYVPARFHNDDGGCANYVDIRRGEGYLYNYGFSSDYEFRIDRVGTFIDKLVGVQMLFMMNADFSQSSFFTDQRATNLSYWTLFKDEMLELMSGIILGDYQQFGAALNGGKFDYVKPVDPVTFGFGVEDDVGDVPRIYTPQSLNHEINMLFLGLMFSSSYMDREVDFTHYVKIATTQDEWQDFGEGVDIVEFVHPITQQIYRAPNVEDRSIGARLINRTNELAERYVEAEEWYQDAEPGTSDYSQRRTIRDRRLEQMQDLVAKMDLIRDAIDQAFALR